MQSDITLFSMYLFHFTLIFFHSISLTCIAWLASFIECLSPPIFSSTDLSNVNLLTIYE